VQLAAEGAKLGLLAELHQGAQAHFHGLPFAVGTGSLHGLLHQGLVDDDVGAHGCRSTNVYTLREAYTLGWLPGHDAFDPITCCHDPAPLPRHLYWHWGTISTAVLTCPITSQGFQPVGIGVLRDAVTVLQPDGFSLPDRVELGLGLTMSEQIISLHVELLPEGCYLATSEAIPGLVAQGRTVAETLEIARDVAKRLLEARAERGELAVMIPVGDCLDLPLVVGG